MTCILEFPSGDLIKKIKRNRLSKLGVQGNPEVAIMSVNINMAPIQQNEDPAYFSVSKLLRGNNGSFSISPICFFKERDLAEAYIKEISNNFIIALPDFVIEELAQNNDNIPF